MGAEVLRFEVFWPEENELFLVYFHLIIVQSFATRQLPVWVGIQLLLPASTHAGSIYPQLAGLRAQKGHSSPMPVLHTASFKAFESKLCLGCDVKLDKNTNLHGLEN